MSILAGDLVRASDLTSFYDRLNVLRRKVGLSNVTAPSVQNKNAEAQDINNLDAAMTTFVSSSRANRWYTKVDNYTTSAGQLIKSALGNDILSQFDTWDQVCYQHYASDYSDYSDDADNYNNCPSYSCQWSGNSGVCDGNCTAWYGSENSDRTQVSSHTGDNTWSNTSWCSYSR